MKILRAATNVSVKKDIFGKVSFAPTLMNVSNIRVMILQLVTILSDLSNVSVTKATLEMALIV